MTGRAALEAEVREAETRGDPLAGLMRALLESLREPLSREELQQISREAAIGAGMHSRAMVRAYVVGAAVAFGAALVAAVGLGAGGMWLAMGRPSAALVRAGSDVCATAENGQRVCWIPVYVAR